MTGCSNSENDVSGSDDAFTVAVPSALEKARKAFEDKSGGKSFTLNDNINIRHLKGDDQGTPWIAMGGPGEGFCTLNNAKIDEERLTIAGSRYRINKGSAKLMPGNNLLVPLTEISEKKSGYAMLINCYLGTSEPEADAANRWLETSKVITLDKPKGP